MRSLLQQIMVKRQTRSLGLYRNIWPASATGVPDLGSHLIGKTSDRGDSLAAWLRVIIGDEYDPHGGGAGRVLAKAKIDPLDSRRQGAVPPNNFVKQTSFVTRCSAHQTRSFRSGFRPFDHEPDDIVACHP